MRALRLIVSVVGTLLSLYFGINLGTSNAESLGGQVVLSIVLVVAGFMIVGIISGILTAIEYAQLARMPEYRLAATVVSGLYGHGGGYRPRQSSSKTKDEAFDRMVARSKMKDATSDREAARMRSEDTPENEESRAQRQKEYWKRVNGE